MKKTLYLITISFLTTFLYSCESRTENQKLFEEKVLSYFKYVERIEIFLEESELLEKIPHDSIKNIASEKLNSFKEKRMTYLSNRTVRAKKALDGYDKMFIKIRSKEDYKSDYDKALNVQKEAESDKWPSNIQDNIDWYNNVIETSHNIYIYNAKIKKTKDGPARYVEFTMLISNDTIVRRGRTLANRYL